MSGYHHLMYVGQKKNLLYSVTLNHDDYPQAKSKCWSHFGTTLSSLGLTMSGVRFRVGICKGDSGDQGQPLSKDANVDEGKRYDEVARLSYSIFVLLILLYDQ